ncbi:MAG: hypothetical protein AB8B50_16440 [Pirellulaceae bacterium]
MNIHKVLIPCFLLVAMSAASAQAQQGWGGLGFSYMYGYNAFGNSSSTYNQSMPYFSQHPPVYYGKRYTRPYGVSPFAAWPQMQPNSSYAPQMDSTRMMKRPRVIANPYMHTAPASAKKPSVVQMRPKRKVIANPFFRSEEVQYTASDREL